MGKGKEKHHRKKKVIEAKAITYLFFYADIQLNHMTKVMLVKH